MNNLARVVGTVIVAALLPGIAMSADWTYNGSTITDGDWTFNATASGTDLTVNACTDWPTAVTPLDFTKPISDGSQTYTIVKLNPQFGVRSSTWGQQGDFKGTPQGAMVGVLTLPKSGLVEISKVAFTYCSNITGTVSLSSDLITIGAGAFDKCVGVTGFDPLVPDSVTTLGEFAFAYAQPAQAVSLKSVKTVNRGIFFETPITSVYFGPAFKNFENCDYKSPTFGNCTALTNVSFDAAISGAEWMSGSNSGYSTFNGCSAIVSDFDLSGFTKLYSQWGNFGCGKVKRVIIGKDIQAIDKNFFGGLTALEAVIFKGNPPATLGLPVYNNVQNSSKQNYKFTTYVYEDYGEAWASYAKDNVINYDDSEFAADKIASGLATSMRPLRYLPSVAPTISSVVPHDVTSNGVTIVISGFQLCGGTIQVEVVNEIGVLVKTVATNAFASICVKGLDILTSYMVRVTATNGAGSTVDDSATFTTMDAPGAELNDSYRINRDWIYRFKRTGINKFRAPAKMSGPAKVLIVGGGGGGGLIYGGGGGGGGVIYREDVTLIPNALYTVTVGAGGVAGTSGSGGKGGLSSLALLDGSLMISTSGGGCGGGGWNAVAGGSGANGGGGCHEKGGASTEIYGFSGGTGTENAGGGGGGAGGAGQNGDARGTGFGGNGGPGVTNAITGVDVVYGYGGGGSGNWYTARNGHYGRGGAMNGYGDSYGVGQYDTPSFPARPGEDGTGGGGGAGAGNSSTAAPACGGSGIVIIRYSELPQGLMLLVR